MASSCRWIRRLGDPSGLADGFLTALRDGSAYSMEQYRLSFETLLRNISDNSVHWLEWFDTFGSEGVPALTQFCNLLSSYENEMVIELPMPHPPWQLRDMINELIHDSRGYDAFRAYMLKFCLDEAITPEIVGQAFTSNVGWTARVPGDVQRLAEDLPMQAVCRAVSIFRA